jgi:hypothetical protein
MPCAPCLSALEVVCQLAAGCGWADHNGTGFGYQPLPAASRAGILAGGRRSWLLLEKVLARTCGAWQSVHAYEQQLSDLHQQHLMLAGPSMDLH